jgi:hypothetical protein
MSTTVRDRYYAAAKKAFGVMRSLTTAPIASARFKAAAADALIVELEIAIEHTQGARKKSLAAFLQARRKALAARAAAIPHTADPYLTITCQCGATCQEVRPGKWQCPKCE